MQELAGASPSPSVSLPFDHYTGAESPSPSIPDMLICSLRPRLGFRSFEAVGYGKPLPLPLRKLLLAGSPLSQAIFLSNTSLLPYQVFSKQSLVHSSYRYPKGKSENKCYGSRLLGNLALPMLLREMPNSLTWA